MYFLKYSLIALLLISLMACNTQKGSGSSSNLNEVEYINDGFSRAEIIYFPENKEHCNYLIQKEDGSLLEPLDLEEKYQKANLSIWIKYNPQRRPSRCEGTTPIGITEIQVAK